MLEGYGILVTSLESHGMSSLEADEEEPFSFLMIASKWEKKMTGSRTTSDERSAMAGPSLLVGASF